MSCLLFGEHDNFQHQRALLKHVNVLYTVNSIIYYYVNSIIYYSERYLFFISFFHAHLNLR